MSRAQKTIRTVANKLKKASKAHASQAKTLDAIKLKKGGKSRVNEAGNYTKPSMRKRFLIVLKQAVKVANLDNGVLVKLKC